MGLNSLKRLETGIDYLNGFPVKAEKELSIPAPAKRTLSEAFTQILAGRLIWELFKQRP